MYVPFVSQRTLRPFLPSLVFLSLCLLLVATTRSLHGSRLPRPTFRVSDHWMGLGRHQKEEQKPFDTSSKERPRLEPGKCTPEMEFLRRQELGLTENIRYTRRCIRPIRSDKVNRDVLTNISTPLVNTAKMATINLTSCARTQLPPCEHLDLHVPNPYPAIQHPHLLFGIASSYERMQRSVDSFATWLSGTGAQLYVIVEDAKRQAATDPDLAKLQQSYRDADIQAFFVAPPPPATTPGSKSDSHAESHITEHLHFILVRSLLTFSQTQNEPGVTKWLAIIDDDTFIPSLYALESRILSKFDPSKPHWIGALSDHFSSVQVWGFMAFGGAGVFLSLPLASQIEPHIEMCIARARIQTGDGILRECIYRYTRTKLTIAEGLYQHDMRGDLSGFYESGVNPVSVHHWKSWYREEIPRMVEIGKVCGACWLQRWKFKGATAAQADGGKQAATQGENEGINDMLLANGYSITEYYPVDEASAKSGKNDDEDDTWDDLDQDPEKELDINGEAAEETWKKGPGALEDIDLARIEGTWGHPTTEFDFSYGPLRRKLGPARKKSYKLVDVNMVAVSASDIGHFHGGGSKRDGIENQEEDGNTRTAGDNWKESKNKEVQLKELRQIYVHRKSDAWEPEEGAMDEVIELIWEV